MKKKVLMFATITSLFFFLIGCKNQTNGDFKDLKIKELQNSIKSYEKNISVDLEVDTAQLVVEKHFQYKNEKNKEKLSTTLTEESNVSNMVWGFENLESIKIINIDEERSETVRKGYLTTGLGRVNGTTQNNLKVYKVKYEVKYKKDGIGPQDSGIHDFWYFVIRKDDNSPWLISSYGI